VHDSLTSSDAAKVRRRRTAGAPAAYTAAQAGIRLSGATTKSSITHTPPSFGVCSSAGTRLCPRASRRVRCRRFPLQLSAFQDCGEPGRMVKHNNEIPNQHFKKKWQFNVKTWFNQPARKVRRRTGARHSAAEGTLRIAFTRLRLLLQMNPSARDDAVVQRELRRQQGSSLAQQPAPCDQLCTHRRLNIIPRHGLDVVLRWRSSRCVIRPDPDQLGRASHRIPLWVLYQTSNSLQGKWRAVHRPFMVDLQKITFPAAGLVMLIVVETCMAR
jgi:Ribosomal protein L13e